METTRTDPHPYLMAKQEWEECNGSLKTRLVNAHRMNALLGLIALAATIGLMLDRRQPPTIPPIAVIDRHGVVLGVASTSKVSGGIDSVKAELLRAWIWEARTVVSEFDAQLSLVLDVMRKTTDDPPGKATTTMRDWYEHHDPYKLAKSGITVTVEVISILRRSNDTYEVEWTETRHSTDGSPETPRQFKGVFRALFRSRADQPENPTGFALAEVDWSPRS